MIRTEVATKRLQTLHTTEPRQIRKQVLETLIELVDADEAAFFKYALRDGIFHYTAIQAVADAEMQEQVIEPLDGAPTLSNQGWNPRLPDSREHQRFVRRQFAPQQLRDSTEHQLLRMFYGRFDINTQLRALLYDGRRFLGWIGCWRRNSKPFGEADEELINTVLDPVIAALTVADGAERELREEPAQLLFEPVGPEIEYATDGGANWLTASRPEHLTQVIRRADNGHALPSRLLIDGFEVRLNRLVGDQSTRYLASIASTEAPRLSPKAALTPRQRDIAEYAAVGATAKEIARTLKISSTTVRHHLKNIYHRLDIGCRAELALCLSVE